MKREKRSKITKSEAVLESILTGSTPSEVVDKAIRNEATRLLRQGFSPELIAKEMKKHLIDIKRHLLTQVGEGELRLSDILFTIDEQKRQSFDAVAREYPGHQHWEVDEVLRERGLCEREYALYLACRNSERGDMYVYLADIEITLHDLIKRTLISRFGENKWWSAGVPLSIRQSCVSAREEDIDPLNDSFSYTTFVNLREIVDKNWGLFNPVLPKKLANDKPLLLSNLIRLNRLRNGVMHPIKGIVIRKDDFDFVQNFRKQIDESNWRFS